MKVQIITHPLHPIDILMALINNGSFKSHNTDKRFDHLNNYFLNFIKFDLIFVPN